MSPQGTVKLGPEFVLERIGENRRSKSVQNIALPMVRMITVAAVVMIVTADARTEMLIVAAIRILVNRTPNP